MDAIQAVVVSEPGTIAGAGSVSVVDIKPERLALAARSRSCPPLQID